MPIDAAKDSDELHLDDIMNTTKFEYRLLMEMKLIASEFNSGSIYVMPTKTNSLHWNGIIFIRRGIFKDAILRFDIELDHNFPAQKPILKLPHHHFEHPLISNETHIFDTSFAFGKWSESDHVYMLLKFFKYSLENFDFACRLPADKVVNSNVVDVYLKDPKEFQAKAHELVVKSNEEIFNENDPENCFTFDRRSLEAEAEIHRQIVEGMKSFKDDVRESFPFLFEKQAAAAAAVGGK